MINRFSHKPILLAALISGCFFVCACENDINEVRELGSKKIGVDEGKNIDSYLSIKGKMRAHLTAPRMLRYGGDSANKVEFPNTLHVDFYNDSTTRIESQLRADYGRFLENEKKVFLRGNVLAFNIKGDTLRCPELYWDQNTGKFYTDKKVIWSQAFRSNLIIGLNGMTCNEDLSLVTFNQVQSGSFFRIPDSTANPAADTTKPK
ncbi:LPS export ABC transporter periplasmic protein LptC [Sediminibacterium soli]|uniref:LPS export ABC transporter periplasmic protein LptC n=1 Tax=Sediminibacterium soli TaxID=2698829 RepID=UPI001379C3ED|nr:LPS export ABC transporter periplasmic protein LptC [Sediminibacterium soli]NCI47722.1 LPS export ABC transporter periplasmic protein LptC [Sediminibacterium soli]